MSDASQRAFFEDARGERATPSIVHRMFMGALDFPLIEKCCAVSEEDRHYEYLMEGRLALLDIDPEVIEEADEMPPGYIAMLHSNGFFREKIPKEFGGNGVNQWQFSKMLEMMSRRMEVPALMCSVTMLGIGQALLSAEIIARRNDYTKEELERILALQAWCFPRLANKSISCFCLTEPDAGTDVENITTTAIPTEDGSGYEISGTKCFITNGMVADYGIVIAKVAGEGKHSHTAFLVGMNDPRITRTRLRFAGYRGLPNALINFNRVRISASRMLLRVGDGKKIAFMNLMYGRISAAAILLGKMEALRRYARFWCTRRKIGGEALYTKQASEKKLVEIEGLVYATRKVVAATSRLVDLGADARIEAAMTKVFALEAAMRVEELARELCGGRGYEKPVSQLLHDPVAMPIERLGRAIGLFLPGEGGRVPLRLMMARELFDPYIQLRKKYQRPFYKKLSAVLGRFGALYALGSLVWKTKEDQQTARPETLKRLELAVFRALGHHGESLANKQIINCAFADIATLVYVHACAGMSVKRDSYNTLKVHTLCEEYITPRVAEAFRTIETCTPEYEARLARLVRHTMNNQENEP